MQTQLLGRTSQGCVYDIKHDFVTKGTPQWAFGSSVRNDENTKEKYEYYFIQDKFSDPLKASDYCKGKRQPIKFSKAARVNIIVIFC